MKATNEVQPCHKAQLMVYKPAVHRGRGEEEIGEGVRKDGRRGRKPSRGGAAWPAREETNKEEDKQRERRVDPHWQRDS